MEIISVCITTFKRQSLLKKCIISLLTQNTPPGYLLEIIIVDNDRNASARQVVQKIMQKYKKANIKYFVEPEKNISLARNKCVENASGKFLLFIDDDEYADIFLIQNFIKCFKNFNADGIFGAVISYYDENVPPWVIKGEFFDRIIQETGDKPKFLRTGNCFIKKQLLQQFEGPFDPQYGLTGGEDINLFSKLQQKGANFIFCAEAIVYDFVPKDRACLNWLIKRTYRTGLTFTSNRIKNSRYKMFSFIWQILKSTTYLFISSLLTVLNLFPKEKRIFWFLKIISNVGHIAGALGFKYYEYR
ncbi:MAG: glycosyltransferase family 2 protein [Ignavibacterium sp.]|jgi:succinoglycan biosynthesis protein ExoM|uniref:glycosyltransferase n=1 Tax=Ignavibacterium sp. TaxID=2651167 RepID=UPI003299F32C